MTRAPRTPGFFQAVHRVVWRIPRGGVMTYGDVARLAGFPGLARQVSWALRAAPGGLPWHRVLGAGGRILLEGSFRLEQRLRLESEGIQFKGNCVELERFGASSRKRSKKRV